MFTPKQAAISFSLLLTTVTAFAWPNIQTSFIVGSGYSTIGGTQSIWLINTPEPGLQNTYTSDGHQRGTFLLGVAFEQPYPTTIKNLESAIGVEVDYLKNSAISGMVHPMVNVDPSFDRLDYSYNMTSYLLFVTAKLIQLNIFANAGAYIQAGVGGALNQLSDYTETTPAGSSAAPMLAPFGNQSNTRVAFSISAGILWQLKKSSLLIGYRFINSGHTSLNTTSVQQTNNTLAFSPCHHLLTLSLTV